MENPSDDIVTVETMYGKDPLPEVWSKFKCFYCETWGEEMCCPDCGVQDV